MRTVRAMEESKGVFGNLKGFFMAGVDDMEVALRSGSGEKVTDGDGLFRKGASSCRNLLLQ